MVVGAEDVDVEADWVVDVVTMTELVVVELRAAEPVVELGAVEPVVELGVVELVVEPGIEDVVLSSIAACDGRAAAAGCSSPADAAVELSAVHPAPNSARTTGASKAIEIGFDGAAILIANLWPVSNMRITCS